MGRPDVPASHTRPGPAVTLAQVMDARRPQVADLGVFLLVVAAPLVLTPFTLSPFGDPKLVAVAGAAVALWAAGFRGNGSAAVRPLVWAAGTWVALTVAAALAGVDPSRGLTAQPGGEGGGLIVVLVCVVVLLAGTGSSDERREKARQWFVFSCTAIGIFGILIRLAPGTFGTIGRLSFLGATMGNQLFAGALLAAGMVAAMGDREQPLSRQLPVVGLLALATATFGERSAVVLPVLGTIAFLIRAHIPWRRAAALGVCVAGVLGGWQIAAAHLPAGGRGASVTVAAQATDSQRFTVWRVLATRAVADRPVLGWGPGSTQSAYLANATEAEVRSTTRLWADAHDLPLETLVTSGILGLLALVAVLGLAGIRALRGPPERAWAVGAAAALGAYALFEPVNLVLTPLLFFFLAVAGRSAPDAMADGTDRAPRGVPRARGRHGVRGTRGQPPHVRRFHLGAVGAGLRRGVGIPRGAARPALARQRHRAARHALGR
jgi:O-antigen ligase